MVLSVHLFLNLFTLSSFSSSLSSSYPFLPSPFPLSFPPTPLFPSYSLLLLLPRFPSCSIFSSSSLLQRVTCTCAHLWTPCFWLSRISLEQPRYYWNLDNSVLICAPFIIASSPGSSALEREHCVGGVSLVFFSCERCQW